MLMMGAAAPSIQVTLFSSTTSTASTISLPASLAAGDVCVLLDTANQLASPYVSGSAPSGYTSVSRADNLSGPVMVSQISYRVLTGSGDLSGSLTGLSGSDGIRKYLLVFRPTPQATGVSAEDVASSTIIAGAPAAETISGGTSPAPVVAIAFATARGAAPAESLSTLTVVGSGNASGVAGYEIFNSGPSDVTVSTGDVGAANCLQSFYLALI